MKKNYLIHLLFLGLFLDCFSQSVTAPVQGTDITTAITTQLRMPNGTQSHHYHRALFFVPASELSSLPSGSVINYLNFHYTSPCAITVIGSIKIYLQNTTDTSNTKSTLFSEIIAPMSLATTNTYFIPSSSTATPNSSIEVQLQNPFTYTGNGLYLATDYITGGSVTNTSAITYAANSTLSSSSMTAAAPIQGVAPTNLTPSSIRVVVTYSTNSLLSNTDFNSDSSFNLLPNPANDLITINLESELLSVEIFSLSGQKVLTSNSKEINISNLNSGIYIVKITDVGGKISNKKLIKK